MRDPGLRDSQDCDTFRPSNGHELFITLPVIMGRVIMGRVIEVNVEQLSYIHIFLLWSSM